MVQKCGWQTDPVSDKHPPPRPRELWLKWSRSAETSNVVDIDPSLWRAGLYLARWSLFKLGNKQTNDSKDALMLGLLAGLVEDHQDGLMVIKLVTTFKISDQRDIHPCVGLFLLWVPALKLKGPLFPSGFALALRSSWCFSKPSLAQSWISWAHNTSSENQTPPGKESYGR